jgi:hypothetical protein
MVQGGTKNTLKDFFSPVAFVLSPPSLGKKSVAEATTAAFFFLSREGSSSRVIDGRAANPTAAQPKVGRDGDL